MRDNYGAIMRSLVGCQEGDEVFAPSFSNAGPMRTTYLWNMKKVVRF